MTNGAETGTVRCQVRLVLRQSLSRGGKARLAGRRFFPLETALRCGDGGFGFKHLLVCILHQRVIRRILLQELRTLGFSSLKTRAEILQQQRVVALLRRRLQRTPLPLLLVSPDLLFVKSNRVLYGPRLVSNGRQLPSQVTSRICSTLAPLEFTQARLGVFHRRLVTLWLRRGWRGGNQRRRKGVLGHVQVAKAVQHFIDTSRIR